MAKKELPDDVKEKIESLQGEAGEADRAGDIRKAIELSQKAWDLIPAPVEQWEYYPQSMSIMMVEDHATIGDAAGIHKWSEIAHKMYDDPGHENHYVVITTGAAYYKIDALDEAFKAFEKIFEKHGKNGFKGEHKEYLKFYMDRAGKK